MPAADNFSSNQSGLDSPGYKGFTVTPHDTNELTFVTRGVWVGGAGDLVVIFAGDSVAVTLVGVPAGTLLPIRVKIIKSTSTTATSIVGLY
jgi:hypothetical protein